MKRTSALNANHYNKKLHEQESTGIHNLFKMEARRNSIFNMLLKKTKKEKFPSNNHKAEEDTETTQSSPSNKSHVKIKISPTKSMTENEFENAVREHRRRMSKKYLTKQVRYQEMFYI